ncbi:MULTISPECIES: hypothetical protein [unclassified Amycolatopsis]|uniref:hypothetical protein n=1 Tax=unclassified Amycolatopsis TaxID=2618356 RepID=UPI002E23C946|nr:MULTISPECIES: hypothetical protein [unclassified Amycolatopsis]
MTHQHSWRRMVAKPAGIRPLHWLVIVGYALVVAGGAKGVSLFTAGMMTGLPLVGGWLMLALGLAYAGVRVRPSIGGALLVGFGVGAVLVVFFAGMRMVG